MTRLTLRCTLAAALASFALLAGCESTPKAKSGGVAMGAINDTCPMSGKPIDHDTTVSYKGHEIGFCCPNCVKGWNSMSTKEKDDYVAQHVKGST